MGKLERKIERQACDTAEAHGWWQRKFTSPGRRGVHDRIFAKDDRFCLIEFKVPGETLDPLQVEEHQAVADCGITESYVCDSVEQVRQILGITTPCQHEWIDARNKAVKSGELCIRCNAIRAGNVI